MARNAAPSEKPRSTIIIDAGGSSIRLWIHQNRSTLSTKAIRLIPPPTASKSELTTWLVKKLKSSSNRPWKKPDLVIIGMRGVWTRPEKESIKKILLKITHSVKVLSDIELQYEIFFGRTSGILLNAGTGSIAFGRDPSQKSARAGGLGPLLGDEGSAFWFGREYLRKAFDSSKNVGLLRKYATSPDAVRKIASLARRLIRRAKKGDKEARQTLASGQLMLVALVDQVRQRLEFSGKAPVKLAGGLFEDKYFRSRFLKKLNRKKYNVLP